MAMAYAISTSKIDLRELDEFKKNYREGSQYQSYIQKNPDHNQKLNELIMRIQGQGYFEKVDKE